MEYYAHKTDDREQTILEHLMGTAELCRKFSVNGFKETAYILGKLHDIGKYAEDFQDKLLRGKNNKYEHSSCGGIELGKLKISGFQKFIIPMMQYCIVGHHTGLPDGGTNKDSSEDTTLNGRLNREKYYTGKSDYSSYANEIKPEIPDSEFILSEIMSTKTMKDRIELYAFFTKYLFSCLTDADFLDTESFCNPEINRKMVSNFDSVVSAVDSKISGFIHDNELRKARKRLQEQAISNSRNSERINILNMPTGSGKTLCSLKIALERLKETGKKRIIYVIPYTSIIEQTANTFNEIFGEYMEILQHHSNYCFDDSEKEETTVEKLKKSTENWDAPFIITTSVQFFQSLYHYKGSGLRKLHNLADSIIIFDEVHMLPLKYLQPCLRGIGYITKYLNSEAIFLSATMPDYSELLKRYIPDVKVMELITDKTDFRYFQKCRYINLGETDFDNVIIKASEYKSSLIIVNKRKTAKEVYSRLSGNKFHLSTYMTPADRSKTIADIKKLLRENRPVTVVSTSLIEAGVDLDFEAVFREISGLDSVLQSGGRCNREGFREFGDVYIFDAGESLQNDIEVRASIVKDMLRRNIDISSEEAVQEYYQRLFRFKDDIIEENSIAKEVNSPDGIPFRTYAMDFEFIKDETISIVINNCEETEKSLICLHFGKHSERRRLQKYSVSIRKNEFCNAFSLGLVSDTGNGVFVLADNMYYNSETGLDLNMNRDVIT